MTKRDWVWGALIPALVVGSWHALSSPRRIRQLEQQAVPEAPTRFIPVLWDHPKLGVWCIGTYIDANNGIFTSIGTLTIAGFTYTLWRVGSGQLRELKRSISENAASVEKQFVIMEGQMAALTDAAVASKISAGAAEKSANALPSIERAYLFIDEEIKLNSVGDARTAPAGEPELVENANYVIKFTFINHGKTPAILEAIRMAAAPSVVRPTKSEVDMLTLSGTLPFGTIIGANSKYGRKLGCPLRMEQAVLEQVEQRKARLYFVGRIGYKDIFGDMRETGFGLEYEPGTQSFMRVAGGELNYYT